MQERRVERADPRHHHDVGRRKSELEVGRLRGCHPRDAQEHPDKIVVSLDPLICPCSTMNRIDEPHLAWVLDELVEGRVVNQITVDPATAESARIALQRMLDIT